MPGQPEENAPQRPAAPERSAEPERSGEPDRPAAKTRPADIHQARESAKIRARRDQRVTYDLPPALRKRIQALAAEQHLPASQLVTLALLRFLRDYEGGEVPLAGYRQPSRSHRYAWNLAYPPELLTLLDKRKKG